MRGLDRSHKEMRPSQSPAATHWSGNPPLGDASWRSIHGRAGNRRRRRLKRL